MGQRVVMLQFLVFLVQWILMLCGFYLLAFAIAPVKLFGSAFEFGKYVDAGLKALAALLMSVTWLFLWDRQVRVLFFRKEKA
jgi:hypothetical protein